MRSSIPTGETMDLGNLPVYWRLIAQEFRKLEALPSLASNRILSARAFDEAQPAGHRTYMGVTRYLNVARDNHEALLGLLEHHGATMWAPWSLLRPTFESSFLAAWLLDPEDGRERRARGLRCEIVDAHEQRKYRAEFKVLQQAKDLLAASEKKWESGSLKTYRTEAAALGRTFDQLRQRIDVAGELPKLSFVREQKQLSPFLVATWRQLSGFEHGFGWALLSGTDRKVEVEIPGGVDAQLVINDESFVNAAKTTYFLLLNACEMLVRRHTEPSRK
ncbi:hypothetical protein ACFTSF_39290 [Kribbella sp. NPDC056951]|uniref:hypothetical protein n=1 Tax=Kribbella sp. NPDC056951 TaxID=3345978 RepID=UPI00363E6DF6